MTTITIPSGSARRDSPRFGLPRVRRSRAVYVLSGAAMVLVGAFIWLAVEHETLRLWNVVVHESGRYTLGQTVFYFPHFLREAPTLFTVALFTVAAYGVPAIPNAERQRARERGRIFALAILGAAGMVYLAFMQTAVDHGTAAAWRNLMQYHTGDDLVSYGSHWRFHWLSTMWLGLATMLASRLAARWLGAPAPSDTRDGRLLATVAWGWFVGLSIVFVPTGEPFLDPRYIGHQAREILTHSLVTLPLGLGMLALCMRRHGLSPHRRRTPVPISVPCVAGVVLIPVYLGLATVLGEALSHGQTAGGLAAMVAAHFFEHVLDYLFVALLCAGAYGVLLTRAGRRTSRDR